MSKKANKPKNTLDIASTIGTPVSQPREDAYDPGRPHDGPKEVEKKKPDDIQQEPNVYDGEWYPEPKVDNQITRYPFSVKSGGVKSSMLDMSNPADVATYDKILNSCLGVRATANIFREKEFFSDTTKTVCILLTVEKFLFRPILQNEQPDTQPPR